MMVHPTWIEHATLTFGGLRSNPTELRVHIMSQSLFYQITLRLSNNIFIFSLRKNTFTYFLKSSFSISKSMDKIYTIFMHDGIIIISMKNSSCLGLDSMDIRIFNRYERKFIITKNQMNELIPFLSRYLDFDPYSRDGKHYTIYNLYFDNDDFSVIRNSIAKPKYKEKLRLRTYDYPLTDTSQVFLEIKKKFQGRVNKRRVILDYNHAKNYLTTKELPPFKDYHDVQMMKEIDYFMKIHKAKPGAYIRYNRVALHSIHDELRITFDHELTYRTKELTLDKIDGFPLLPSESYILMEIKSDQNFPLWLARKLSELKIYSQSFSKYGKAYEKYIGGLNDDVPFIHD